MSYWVGFTAKLEGADQYVMVNDGYNYTSNLRQVIVEVCNGLAPPQWNDMKCSELTEILWKGITELSNYPEKYRHYEPDNGWGTIETLKEFLQNVHAVCVEYPTAEVSVSY